MKSPAWKTATSRRVQYLLLGVTVLLALGFSLLVEQVYRLEQQRLANEGIAETVREATRLRASLEAELNTALYLPVGLGAYVHAHWDDLDSQRIQAALAQVVRQGKHVRNIVLAPDNVIRHVYPLAGNEAAMGLNYRKQLDQWPEVELAMSERRSVMAGPLDLVQGGRGLIHRTPVFLDDGRYWGIVSMVLDVDSLFESAGLACLDGGHYALRRRSEASNEWVGVCGNPALFRESSLSDRMVAQSIQLPGAEWQLAWSVNDPNGMETGPSLTLLLRWPGHLLALAVLGFGLLLLIERRRAEHLVNHDPLTGLPNRRLLMEKLASALRRRRQLGTGFGLIYLDLDGFKPINDRLGHDAGDRLLIEVARRLRAGLPPDGSAVRLGGDEFVVLLPGHTSRPSIDGLARELLERIRQPIELGIEEVSIDASAGVAICPCDGENADLLLRRADQQMYARKAERRLSELRPALY
ncbi:MAG: diguanylate cyclase domain-containing protein [Wenzhouxiangella sp.]